MSDVTKWRLADAAKRLTGGRIQYTPPPEWKCGVEPTPALPIDKAITRLRDSNTKYRLHSGLGPCAYYAARIGTCLALDAATVQAADDPRVMAARWKRLEKAAADAASGIAIIGEALKHDDQAPRTRWPAVEPSEVERALKLIFALHETHGLDHITAFARQARSVFQNNQGEIWRAVFAADLGFLWCELTGEPPARSEPFLDFVSAAYDSLGQRQSVTWDRPVKRALAMRLDWHRYRNILQNLKPNS